MVGEVHVGHQVLDQIFGQGKGGVQAVLEGFRAFFCDQRVGIVAVGQEHEFELSPVARQGEGILQRPPGCLSAGAIAVEAEHHFAGQLENLVEMLLSGCGAEGGHGIGNPRLVQAHDVHIAFDDHQALEIRPCLPRFVQSVRVRVPCGTAAFRGSSSIWLALIDDPAAEADDASAGIANRKHQSIAEAVVKAGRAFAALRVAL